MQWSRAFADTLIILPKAISFRISFILFLRFSSLYKLPTRCVSFDRVFAQRFPKRGKETAYASRNASRNAYLYLSRNSIRFFPFTENWTWSSELQNYPKLLLHRKLDGACRCYKILQNIYTCREFFQFIPIWYHFFPFSVDFFSLNSIFLIFPFFFQS